MQVTWKNTERPIKSRSSIQAKDYEAARGASNHAIKSRSSLKGGGTWHIITHRRIVLKMIESQSFIKKVITAEIKTDENTSGALDQDWTDRVSCVSSSRVMWRNLGNPSPIQKPQLNCND